MSGKAPNQPGGNTRCGGTRGHHERKAGHAGRIRPSDQCIAQPVRPGKGKPERSAHQADSRTNEER